MESVWGQCVEQKANKTMLRIESHMQNIKITKSNISLILKGYGILGIILCVLGFISTLFFYLFFLSEKDIGRFVLFFLFGIIVHLFYLYAGLSLQNKTKSFINRFFDKWGEGKSIIILIITYFFFSSLASVILG